MSRSRSSLGSWALAAALFAAPLVTGCQTAYYETMEMFGQEKRDLLRSELTGMVDDQEDAEEAFTDALTRVKALTGFDGGDLEREYDALKGAYDDAVGATEDIDSRMDEIETVSADLFEEWEREIGEMTSASLKGSSRRQLRDTKARYERMHASLLETRSSMDPALALLKDHVLFLKHNLNAAAVGALGDEMRNIEAEIEELKRSIQRSIEEAQGFIEVMP
jgi:chromosome segregation ATPase